MGKATRFHPIGLHVIRGAAEYCGFKFGRLRQIQLSTDRRGAGYMAEIVEFPGSIDPDKASQKNLIGALRRCFMDDIQVRALWRTRKGSWMCDLDVRIDRVPAGDNTLPGFQQVRVTE